MRGGFVFPAAVFMRGEWMGMPGLCAGFFCGYAGCCGGKGPMGRMDRVCTDGEVVMELVGRLEGFLREFALLSELQRFLPEFETAYQKAVRAGHYIDVFEGFGIGRDEVRNCRVLAWLLDKNGSHGMGALFLQKIVKRLKQKTNGNRQELGISDAALASGWESWTEVCPSGQDNRLDIVCEGEKLLLYMEVKIMAAEHGDQTKRYYKELEKHAHGREHALIFLSVEKGPDSKDAYHLTWGECAEILLEMAGEKDGSCRFMRDLMRQYAVHIRHFLADMKKRGETDAVQS